MLMGVSHRSMAARVTTDHLTTYFLSLTLKKPRGWRVPRASNNPGGPIEPSLGSLERQTQHNPHLIIPSKQSGSKRFPERPSGTDLHVSYRMQSRLRQFFPQCPFHLPVVLLQRLAAHGVSHAETRSHLDLDLGP